MQCFRGWLIAKNDTGFDVPFFLKVRNTEIYYPSNISTKFEEAGVLDSGTIADKVIPPGQDYLFTKGPWECILNNNESFSISSEIRIERDGQLPVGNNKITIHVPLPWKVQTTSNLGIHIYKECDAMDLILAQINIVKDTPSAENDIQGFTIELYKHDGSLFSPDCLTDGSYTNCKLHVSVTGIAQLGEFSHSDDANNVGMSWDSTVGGIGAKDVYTKTEILELLESLRQEVESGALVDPTDIIDLVNRVEDSSVRNNGFVLDIDEGTNATTLKITPIDVSNQNAEQRDINEKVSDQNIMQIDISQLGNFTFKKE